MHVKFESNRRSWNFSRKNADSAGYRNIMKIPYLFKIHQISSNLQNLLELSSETCMWNFQSSPNFINLTEFTEIIIWNMHVKFESIQRSENFSLKNAHSAGYRNIMKIPYLFKVFKVFKISWKYADIEILWNFHIFSKFTKFHQTDRIYWNHNLKHAFEIWVHTENVKYFIEKCRQCWL